MSGPSPKSSITSSPLALARRGCGCVRSGGIAAVHRAPPRHRSAAAPIRIRRDPSRTARRPFASRSTGRPTPTTRASSWRSANGWYADAGVDLQILPVREHDARGPDRGRPGRVRDQLPGRADVRGRRPARRSSSVMAILQHTAPGDRRARRRRTSSGRATSTVGSTRGFGYPNEEPTLKSVIKADGGKGDVQDASPSTRPPTRRSTRSEPTSRSRSRPGRASRPSSAASSCGLRLHRLRLPGLLPGRPRLRPRLAGARARRSRERFVGATVRGFELAATRPGRRGRPAGRREPGRLRRQPGAARSRASGSSRRAATWSTPTARSAGRRWRALAGLLRLPVRAGPAGRTERQAADRAARLRGAVHERLPAMTAGRSRLGRWGPPLALVAVHRRRSGRRTCRLAGIEPDRRCRRRRGSLGALWDFRGRGGRATSCRRSSRPLIGLRGCRSLRDRRGACADGPGRRRPAGGRAAARRVARRSRSWRSRRCS